VHESLVVQVFGRRDDGLTTRSGGPVAEKRQGTKSREVGHWRGNERYGDYMSGGTVKPFLPLLLRFLLFDRAAGFLPPRP
jgi:hypothetical protein